MKTTFIVRRSATGEVTAEIINEDGEIVDGKSLGVLPDDALKQLQKEIEEENPDLTIKWENCETEAPQRSHDADQEKPRRHYVYAHVDSSGKMFYIGKGIGRRAWSKERHLLWTRYVERHLKGHYTVEILEDNLSADEAEEIESDWITYYGAELVNWENFSRETDFKALEIFHELRNKNKQLLRQARETEKKNLESAAKMYIEAIAAIPSYQLIKYEGGLIGQLMDEQAEEIGHFGEVEALDRLTMCLIKLGRVQEASKRANEYFKLYKGDLNRVVTQRIQNRIAKALMKL
jgi:hypothetical protein